MTLKGILSIDLFAIALYASFAKLPIWDILLITIVLVIAIVFAIACIQGKGYLWKEVFQEGGLKLYRSLLITDLNLGCCRCIF